MIERAREFGVAPGVSLKKLFGETYGEGLLIAITERRSREDIDRLATVLTILSAETGDTKQPFTRGTSHAESLSTSFTESVGV